MEDVSLYLEEELSEEFIILNQRPLSGQGLHHGTQTIRVWQASDQEDISTLVWLKRKGIHPLQRFRHILSEQNYFTHIVPLGSSPPKNFLHKIGPSEESVTSGAN